MKIEKIESSLENGKENDWMYKIFIKADIVELETICYGLNENKDRLLITKRFSFQTFNFHDQIKVEYLGYSIVNKRQMTIQLKVKNCPDKVKLCDFRLFDIGIEVSFE